MDCSNRSDNMHKVQSTSSLSKNSAMVRGKPIITSESKVARVVSTVHQNTFIGYAEPGRYSPMPTRGVTIVQGSAHHVPVAVSQNSTNSGKPLPVTTQTGNVLFPVARNRKA